MSLPENADNEAVENGAVREINGKKCVYFDGYWLRHYPVHAERIADKKLLIDQMTRRVFHHVEVGINTPGYHLEKIRDSHKNETNPHKKRVKAAMLAGALLNRGRDILTSIVNMESSGVIIGTDNPLYTECDKCLSEALELGQNIKLNDGGEGNTELWGEPFRVFSMPIKDFFETRYIKLAQTMSEIDKITGAMMFIMSQHSEFDEMKILLTDFSTASKEACETLRSDPEMFEIWPKYIAAKELFEEYQINLPNDDTAENEIIIEKYHLIMKGAGLLSRHANLRVPIPESVNNFLQQCESFPPSSDDKTMGFYLDKVFEFSRNSFVL